MPESGRSLAQKEQTRYSFTSAPVSHGLDGRSDNNLLVRSAQCTNRHAFFFFEPVHDILPGVTPCLLLLSLEVRQFQSNVHSCDLYLSRKDLEDIEDTGDRFDMGSIPEALKFLGARQQRRGLCVSGCVHRRLHLTVKKCLSICTVQ